MYATSADTSKYTQHHKKKKKKLQKKYLTARAVKTNTGKGKVV